MTIYSRRHFLKSIGAVAAFFAVSPKIFPFSSTGENFEMLVIGDSLIWGQGLEEKDKFYTLTKNWLQSELNKQVNLKVKAHSGATILLHNKEKELLQKGGMPETTIFHPEVPVSFPTLKTQIDAAKIEYQTPEKVDLVMLTGGLVDITVAGILNPWGRDKILRDDIKKYCNEDMFELLDHSADIFKNALFIVVGYFPIVSPTTDTAKMLNAVLEAYGIPRPLKPFVNNILIRQFFKPMKKKALKRSRIWVEDSNREFESAVNRLNEKLGSQRAVFVKSMMNEDASFETQNTQLTTMGENGRPKDAFYETRRVECKKVLTELKKINQT